MKKWWLPILLVWALTLPGYCEENGKNEGFSTRTAGKLGKSTNSRVVKAKDGSWFTVMTQFTFPNDFRNRAGSWATPPVFPPPIPPPIFPPPIPPPVFPPPIPPPVFPPPIPPPVFPPPIPPPVFPPPFPPPVYPPTIPPVFPTPIPPIFPTPIPPIFPTPIPVPTIPPTIPPPIPPTQPNGCALPGQFLPDPSTPCRYLECVYGPEAWPNQIGVIPLVTIFRLCPPGTAVPGGYQGGFSVPCVASSGLCKGIFGKEAEVGYGQPQGREAEQPLLTSDGTIAGDQRSDVISSLDDVGRISDDVGVDDMDTEQSEEDADATEQGWKVVEKINREESQEEPTERQTEDGYDGDKNPQFEEHSANQIQEDQTERNWGNEEDEIEWEHEYNPDDEYYDEEYEDDIDYREDDKRNTKSKQKITNRKSLDKEDWDEDQSRDHDDVKSRDEDEKEQPRGKRKYRRYSTGQQRRRYRKNKTVEKSNG